MAWHEPKKDEKHAKGDLTELFAVTEARMREIHNDLEHIKIDAKEMTQIAEALDLQNSGELAFKAFLFGRLVEQNEFVGKLSEMKDFLRRG